LPFIRVDEKFRRGRTTKRDLLSLYGKEILYGRGERKGKRDTRTNCKSCPSISLVLAKGKAGRLKQKKEEILGVAFVEEIYNI